MTDEEIICTWMEPDAPKDGTGGTRLQKFSPKGWWRYSMLSCLWKQPIFDCCPEVEKLGRLWEVEERIKRMPLGARSPYYNYGHRLAITTNGDTWHADARQKIAALAHVLRPIVEASNA